MFSQDKIHRKFANNGIVHRIVMTIHYKEKCNFTCSYQLLLKAQINDKL